MKRIVLVLVAMLLLCMNTYAQDTFSEKEIGIDLNSLVPTELENEISFSEDEDFSEKAEKANKALDLKRILDSISKSVREAFSDCIRAFSGLFAIIILSSLAGIFKDSFGQKFRNLEYIMLVAMSWFLFSAISPMIDGIKGAVETLCTFGNSFFSTVCALSIMGGEATSGAMTNVSVTFMISVIQNISTYAIFPIIKLCFVMAIVSSLCTSVSFRGVSSMMKNICVYGTVALSTVFTWVIFLQKSVSQSADSLNVRISKFAVSSLFPIVGNMVGESLRTVLGSVALIKSITGVLGICSIIYFIIPPVCAILLYKLIISICTVASTAMGLSKQSEMLSDINGILTIMNSALLCVAVPLIVAAGILMSSIPV